MRSLLKKTVRNGIYVCIITFTLLYLIMVLKVNKIASYNKGAKSHIQMIQWTNNTRNHTNSKQSALVRIKLIDVFESKYNNNLQHSKNGTKQGFNFIQDNGETNHVSTLGTDVRGEDYFKSWNDKGMIYVLLLLYTNSNTNIFLNQNFLSPSFRAIL